MLKKIRGSDSATYAIATIIVGASYMEEWEMAVKRTWLCYCEKYDLELYVLVRPFETQRHDSIFFQKWLIPKFVGATNKNIELVCYLDSDVIISYRAPNIFNQYCRSGIGVISQQHLPFSVDVDILRRKIALLRRAFVDSNFPLASSLTVRLPDVYGLSGFPPQADYACAGVFLSDTHSQADFLSEAYFNFTLPKTKSLCGGEEVAFNALIQRSSMAHWIDYEWQALWLFEVAEYYPFLYASKFDDPLQVTHCIESILQRVNFLHFAGSFEGRALRRYDVSLFSLDSVTERLLDDDSFCQSDRGPTGRYIFPD